LFTAQALELFADVQLVVSLGLRQEVLVTKIMGRRRCNLCKKTFNVHEIHLPASDDGLPEVRHRQCCKDGIE
jgi:adenylate kinase